MSDLHQAYHPFEIYYILIDFTSHLYVILLSKMSTLQYAGFFEKKGFSFLRPNLGNLDFFPIVKILVQGI